MPVTPEQIDAHLPQTQCGLCGYGGCMPYAEALVFEKAAINLCPPGGVATLKTLADLLQQDESPYLAEMHEKTKAPTQVVIREEECIGCTKCIQVCPVDAILGGAKQMHTVIASECTGCDLCIPACPVDCIDIVKLTSSTIQDEKKILARTRFNARQNRKAKELENELRKKSQQSSLKKQNYIEEAIARAKLKKQK